MTMQVGMVGTDGILIASDTRYMNQGSGVRGAFNASKITVNYERGIAISRAHAMETAKRVAEAIVSDLKDSELKYPIPPMEKIASVVVDPAGNRKQVECLIILVKPSPRLFYLQSGIVDLVVHCEEMHGAVNTGDKENPAVFWRDRYYERLPIRTLVPLAAHLIVSAGRLNNAAIGGLEIVLCDASGLRRLSDDSIRELELTADGWDKSIGGMFFNHRQQFTYAPDVAGKTHPPIGPRRAERR